MTHEDHRAVVSLDCVLERFDGFDVEVIRRLIQNEQVGARQHENRQREARALAARQRVGAAQHFLARESEAAEVSLYLTALPFRAQRRDDIVERLVERHLRHILPIVAGGDRPAEPELAATQRMLAQERPEQRGLPRPVASDNPHHARSLQRPVESIDQGARADPHAHVLCAHHLIAAPLGHLEAQRHRAVGPDDWAEPWQPLETFAPAFGLLGVLSGNVARDVVLLVRDGALLLLERPLLRQPALGALGDKVGVAGRIRRGGAAFEVQHVIHGGRQKGAVMAHEQHGPLARGEVLLEPAGRLEIEVIRRLVEQQDVGGGHELAGEAESAELAPAQRGQRRDAGLSGIELEAVQYRVDARRDGVTTLPLEALQIFAVLGQRAGRGVVGKVGGLLHQRLLQRQQLGELAGRRLPDCRRGAVVAVLLEQRHAEARRAHDAPARRLEIARQQPEEGRLAGAVPAHDAPAFAWCDGEGNVGEEFGGAEVHADTGESYRSHATIYLPCQYRLRLLQLSPHRAAPIVPSASTMTCA